MLATLVNTKCGLCFAIGNFSAATERTAVCLTLPRRDLPDGCVVAGFGEAAIGALLAVCAGFASIGCRQDAAVLSR